MAQRIEMDIDDEGNVSVHVVGGKGKSCKKQVDAFKGAFGKTLTEGTKPEYFQPETNRNVLINGVTNG